MRLRSKSGPHWFCFVPTHAPKKSSVFVFPAAPPFFKHTKEEKKNSKIKLWAAVKNWKARTWLVSFKRRQNPLWFEYSRGGVGEKRDARAGAQKRLAGFKLHNVAVTPLWLITSLRSLQSQPLSSSFQWPKSCTSPRGGGGGRRSAWWDEAADGCRTLRPAEWLGKMEGSGGGCSGEVHGPQCVVVDLNGLGQRLGVPAVTLPWDVAALRTARRKWHGEIMVRLNK